MLITNGGKHAVYNTFEALLNPGDEVLLPGAVLDHLPRAHRARRGRTSVVLPTDEATGFRVTVEQLEAARTPNTKALVFVSPSNPTGAVYPADEVKAIGEWALEHGIWVDHRRDLRAPHLRRQHLHLDPGPGPRAGRHLRREGGSAIPYWMEDPYIRAEYTDILRREGVENRMDPQFYDKTYTGELPKEP